MKKNLIFKTVALGAMVVGGVAIAKATAARIRRVRDEEETANTLVEADVIAENFSGVIGKSYPMRKNILSRASLARKRVRCMPPSVYDPNTGGCRDMGGSTARMTPVRLKTRKGLTKNCYVLDNGVWVQAPCPNN